MGTAVIASVTLWSNANVTVLDPDGRQLPEYQGRIDAVLEKVLADAPPEARFFVGVWGAGQIETTRGCFECWREVVRRP
jgi:hypothetical protein